MLNQLQSLTDCLLKDCESVQDAKHQTVLGKLLSICPHDVAEHVLDPYSHLLVLSNTREQQWIR